MMTSAFNSFLAKNEAPVKIRPMLPLTHGTTALRIRDILSSGRISINAERCDTLSERLAFTFYGRPAYKVRPGDVPLRQGANAACYVILNPDLIERCYIMHALDTGAFSANLTKAEVDSSLAHSNFRLDPTSDKISDLVSYYFGSSAAYYECLCKSGLEIDQFEFEAYAFYALLNSKNTESYLDERNSTIELAFNEDIELTSRSLIGLLIPDTFAQSDIFAEQEENLNAIIATYRLTHHYTASQHVSRVSDALREFYISNGFLDV